MTDKKISVFFNMLDKNGYTFSGLHTSVATITPSQAHQITELLSSATPPMAKFGLCKMTALYKEGNLEINRTFDPETLDDEEYIMMHCIGQWCNCPTTIHKKCIQNLSSGRCQNKYMRDTVGTVLFPQHYASQRQK